jgi:integrase
LVTRFQGKVVFVTLGKPPGIALSTARELARAGLGRIARGDDPRTPKRPAPAGPDTVEALAARFIAEWCQKRNRGWREQARVFTRCVLPTWGGRGITTLTRADVIALTDAIAQDRPVLANRTLSLVKKFFVWCLDRDLIAAHPAVGLRPPGLERPRTRVLSDAELAKVWRAASVLGYPWGVAVQLLVLTATRPTEVGACAWSEFELGDRLWTIPPERYKTEIPLVLPLAPLAVELLAACPRFDGCAYVFTAREGKPLSDWTGAVERVRALAGVGAWQLRDIRRTTRTGLSRLGIAADIGERVLGHKIAGVRAHYDLHAYIDEKRDALERWAAHVSTVTRVSTQDRAILRATLGELARRSI